MERVWIMTQSKRGVSLISGISMYGGGNSPYIIEDDRGEELGSYTSHEYALSVVEDFKRFVENMIVGNGVFEFPEDEEIDDNEEYTEDPYDRKKDNE